MLHSKMPASIEDYFHALLSIVDQAPIVRGSNTTLDKRTTKAGLIRGEIDMIDGSRLCFRELADQPTLESVLNEIAARCDWHGLS